MYLCFETEDKRLAFPEASLVNMDDNGFTLKGMAPGKGGDMVFLKSAAFQGCMPDFTKALTWIKKKPKPAGGLDLEITNSAGNTLGAAQRPAAPVRPAAPAQAQKLPEAPSF